MSRLILLIAVAFAGLYLYRRFVVGASLTRSSRPLRTVDMVQCRHCGIHLPSDESVEQLGHYFCSVEHRDAHKKGRD